MQPENKQYNSDVYGQPGLGAEPGAGFGPLQQNAGLPQPQAALPQTIITPAIHPDTPGLPINSQAVVYTDPSLTSPTLPHRPLAFLRRLPRGVWLSACAILIIGSAAAAAVYTPAHKTTHTSAAQQHPQVATKPDTTQPRSKASPPKQTQATTTPQPTTPTPKQAVKPGNSSPVSNPGSPSGGVSSAPNYTVSEMSPYVAGIVTYYYAVGTQIVTGATGASVDATLASPAVPYDPSNASNHSLVEMAVNVGGGYNYVEIGWNVGDNFYNNQHPHMFISRWIGGSNICEPQPTGCGFIQVSATNLPDEELGSSGTVNFKVNYSGGNWNVYFNGDLVGYFPESLWGSGHSTVSEVQIYGEVTEPTGSTACTQMGNGISGASAGSTSVSNYTLIASPEPAALSSFNETASQHYYLGSPSATGFNLGGPGC